FAPPSLPVQPAAPPTGTGAPAGGAPPGAAAPAAPGAPVQAGAVAAPAVVPTSAIPPLNARITVTLDNIPLGEALRYIAAQAGLKIKVEPYAVSVIPLTEQSSDLVTKRYHVPPEFFGGPLDVGYYLQGQTATVAGGSGNQAAVQPAPVSSNKIDQEATVFERTATAGHAAGTSTETVGI